MYYHPLALVTSGHGRHAEQLATLALYTWARKQKMRIEAMDAIYTNRLQALPVPWATHDALALFIHGIAACAPLGVESIALATRAAQLQAKAQSHFAALLRHWIEDWFAQLDAPAVRHAGTPALDAPASMPPSPAIHARPPSRVLSS